MITLSYTVSDANGAEAINAIAARHGYTATLPDPVIPGQTIPNPETKPQFAKRIIWELIQAEIHGYRDRQASMAVDKSPVPVTIA